MPFTPCVYPQNVIICSKTNKALNGLLLDWIGRKNIYNGRDQNNLIKEIDRPAFTKFHIKT